MNAYDKNAGVVIPDAQLLADEAEWSSFGDTVHYVDPPKTCRCGTRQSTSATATSA
jgi:4-aminobutyrate aminotransferase/(S)-3-amino-2-methylpropionate transaminase